MLTEKIARKPLSIGAVRLVPGDVVSDEVGSLLPPGRLQTLVDQGWLSERPVNASNQSGGSLDRLEAMVIELQERVATLEARRGPGRPRKTDNGI